MKKSYFFLLFCLPFGLFAQKKKEAAVQTPEMPTISAARTKIIEKDSLKMVAYLELELTDVKESEDVAQLFLSQYKASWFLTSEYGSREKLANGSVALLASNINREGSKIRLSFEFSRLKRDNAVLFVELVNTFSRKKIATDALVRFTNLKLSDQYVIFDTSETTPNFLNYVTVGQRFMIGNPNLPTEKFFMIQYEHSFDQAQSPMAATPRNASKNMKVNVVREIQSNKMISFAEEGLYFVVRDTANMASGIAILGVDDRFPRVTTVEQIIKPLVYVSTNREMSELNVDSKNKLALDTYLIKLAKGNQQIAKEFVRDYYRNIEEANRLFTTYKEGWKTDKGMIFSILGAPNKVQRSRDREVWSYSQNQGFAEMVFNFTRKPNPFTDNHYELIRYPEYQDFWYEKIEAWRTAKR